MSANSIVSHEVSKLSSPLRSSPFLHLQPRTRQSQVENLFEDPDSVLWPLDRVPNRPRIGVDLVVVATLESLVAEEVDVLVVDAGEVLGWIGLGFDVL